MDPNKIERVYTSYAGFYDKVFGKVFHEGRESAIRNLNVQPDERILEVGVGTGLALPMYPRHCRIVGIDLSEGMLARAKEKAEAHRLDHVELHRMDAGAMEFSDDSFDTVVAAYVVTAVPDYRKVVNEMIRVCRPGGRIIMLNHFSNGNKVIAAVDQTPRMANRLIIECRFGRNVSANRPKATCQPVTVLGFGRMRQRKGQTDQRNRRRSPCRRVCER
jgi:phosphatidylethanolamine/phosphatidyl-N-methylethanolamine N-methyltransferase